MLQKTVFLEVKLKFLED